MPEVSRFFGIVIKIFYDDHNPPHFHASYGDDEAVVDIETLGLFAGSLAPRAQSLVVEWASLHRGELFECWERARNLMPPGKIPPSDRSSSLAWAVLAWAKILGIASAAIHIPTLSRERSIAEAWFGW